MLARNESRYAKVVILTSIKGMSVRAAAAGIMTANFSAVHTSIIPINAISLTAVLNKT